MTIIGVQHARKPTTVTKRIFVILIDLWTWCFRWWNKTVNFFGHFVGVFVFSWKRENRKLSRLSLELQDIRNPKKHLSRMEVISSAKKEILYYHRNRCSLIVFLWDVLRQTKSTNRLNCVSRNSGCWKYLFSKPIASPPLNLLYYSLFFLKESAESLMMKVFCGFLSISIVNSKKKYVDQ